MLSAGEDYGDGGHRGKAQVSVSSNGGDVQAVELQFEQVESEGHPRLVSGADP